MKEEKSHKIQRVLDICSRLMEGQIINKTEEAQNYRITERSIQRDIDDIRSFLDVYSSSTGLVNNVIYDRRQKGYRLEHAFHTRLSNSEMLAICKVLMDSRAFSRTEMQNLLDKLLQCCVSGSNRKFLRERLKNRMLYYVEPQHQADVTETLWELGQAVRACQYIEIEYQKQKGQAAVKYRLKPMAVIFSEFYFHLAAFPDERDISGSDVSGEPFPMFYRVDRIQSLNVLDEYFHTPHSSRDAEGEFLKRIQFMDAGRLKKVTFRYFGDSAETVLDRLPTARILSEEADAYVIEAEVFGDGIDAWLKGLGNQVQRLDEESA